MRFFITQHCQQRYIQRVRNNKFVSENILREILFDINKGIDITNKIYDEIPRFILYLYEKYKTANIKIIKKDHIFFICQKRKGTDHLFDVLTCYFDNGVFLEQFKNTVLSKQDIFIKISLIKKQLK